MCRHFKGRSFINGKLIYFIAKILPIIFIEIGRKGVLIKHFFMINHLMINRLLKKTSAFIPKDEIENIQLDTKRLSL